ncbi:MAG: AAA family ATPase [Chrysiogenia bacterium]
MFKRKLVLSQSEKESCFLWGPRQTGKSTLLKTLFPDAKYYDLLLADLYRSFVTYPERLRQECEASGLNGSNQKQPIVIDEVQKIPGLLDEVHWLIENRGLRFILCGSSPRKLKRSHANLLGGRAIRYELMPLTSPEIPDFSLQKALNHGLLPRHYLSAQPGKLLEAYVGDYLKEEIAVEAVTRNIPAFSRFLEVAALSNGEMINFLNIASDCGVSAHTVKGYFQILEDTLIGRFLPAFRRRVKRRLIQAPRFFFFDTGMVSWLARRGPVQPGSELFGHAFEHFLVMEVFAWAAYSERDPGIAYWRTASQLEVDLVLGDGQVAVEIKSTTAAGDHHLRGLRAFRQEHEARCYLVSLDPRPRLTSDGLHILPWRDFLDRLWSGRII